MNIDDFRSLYVEYGFFWNSEITEFVQLYGGRKVVVGSKNGVSTNEIHFCLPIYITNIRSNCAEVRLTAAYLGEEIAPVGDWNGSQTVLYLTKSGRLFGFCDYQVVRWGENPHWRASVECMIAGTEPLEVGIVET